MIIENYHEKSIQWEDKYTIALLFGFNILLDKLNNLDILTYTTINETITSWLTEYGIKNKEIIKKHIIKVVKYANKIIPNTQPQYDEINNTINNDYQLLNVTTDYVRHKYIELGLLEHNPRYSIESSDKFIQSIINNIETKIGLFATMSTMLAFSSFIFDNALAQEYTEYKWRTQRDSKVRHTHAAMDNRWVKINGTPPHPVGCHVGEDYGCRCWAIEFR